MPYVEQNRKWRIHDTYHVVDTPDPPCEKCPHEEHCKLNALGCGKFLAYVNLSPQRVIDAAPAVPSARHFR